MSVQGNGVTGRDARIEHAHSLILEEKRVLCGCCDQRVKFVGIPGLHFVLTTSFSGEPGMSTRVFLLNPAFLHMESSSAKV